MKTLEHQSYVVLSIFQNTKHFDQWRIAKQNHDTHTHTERERERERVIIRLHTSTLFYNKVQDQQQHTPLSYCHNIMILIIYMFSWHYAVAMAIWSTRHCRCYSEVILFWQHQQVFVFISEKLLFLSSVASSSPQTMLIGMIDLCCRRNGGSSSTIK